jgi:hypothetical protein
MLLLDGGKCVRREVRRPIGGVTSNRILSVCGANTWSGVLTDLGHMNGTDPIVFRRPRSHYWRVAQPSPWAFSFPKRNTGKEKAVPLTRSLSD